MQQVIETIPAVNLNAYLENINEEVNRKYRF